MSARSDIAYGRAGGRFIDPATPDLADEQRRRKDPADRWCRLCLDLGANVKIADHPTDLCDACGGYRCHHRDDDETLCWEGRARCAAAKRDRLTDLGDRAATWPGPPWRYLTDLEQDDLDRGLNGVELRALAVHPDPPMLTAGGYVLDTSRTTEAGHWKRQVC